MFNFRGILAATTLLLFACAPIPNAKAAVGMGCPTGWSLGTDGIKHPWYSNGFLDASVSYDYAMVPCRNDFYVSPTGNDATTGLINAPLKSIQTTLTLINSQPRLTTRPVNVWLRNGTFNLTAPIALTQANSGIEIKAYLGEKPTITGAKKLTNWALYDSRQNIYRSYFGLITDGKLPREMYVNDTRATRARSGEYPSGFTATSLGYTMTNPLMASYQNVSDIEILTTNLWKAPRCGVASIVGNAITVKQPCWENITSPSIDTYPSTTIAWIENAYELIDRPGEWYYNRTDGYVYYKPLSTENLATADVQVPTLEALLTITGSNTVPVQNINIRDITFKYGTWYGPAINGYASMQSGYHWVGNLPFNGGNIKLTQSPGNIICSYCNNVNFKHNTFSKLSSTALSFPVGGQNLSVENNRFEDISGSALNLGNVTWFPGIETYREPNGWSRNVVIKDNYIIKTGQQYQDTAAINLGFVDHVSVLNNEISDIPYSGISLGWFTNGPTIAGFNQIKYNKVHDFMQFSQDGGGIYNVGNQNGTVEDSNYVYNQFGTWQGGGLYFDLYSKGLTLTNNVVQNNEYPFLWYFSAEGNTVQNNYLNQPVLTANKTIVWANPTARDNGSAIVTPNTIMANNAVPTAAQAIINGSGISPSANQDVKINPTLPTNLALNQPVTVSSTASGGFSAAKGVDNIVDNTLTGAWAPTGIYYRSGPTALTTDLFPWFQVDLGASKKITTIELVTARFYDNPDMRKNFDVRVSNDPTFATYSTVYSQGGDALNLNSKVGVDVPTTTTYRYVRVIKTQSEYFGVAELRVY